MRGTNNENEMFDRDIPKIEIPKFNGDYRKWPTFRNMFEELVHVRNISNVKKIVQLQQFFIDESAVILGQLEPGIDSYEETRARVKETFENKRELTKIICGNVFNQPAIKEESSVAVKQFYNTTNRLESILIHVSL